METFRQAEEPRIIEGEYIVIFKEQWNREISKQVGRQADQLREEILQAHNIQEGAVLNRYRYAIKGFAAKLSDKQVNALKNDPRVAKISPNALLRLGISSISEPTSVTEAVSLPITSYSMSANWGVARVGGPLNGTGLTAWVLDTGIDLTHPDLNVDVQNSTSFIATEPANDGNGHGTHVAGIIASTGNNTGIQGVAAGATVVAIKVCFDDPQLGCPANSILNGVDYIAIRADSDDIVNMSLGGPDPNENLTAIDDAVISAANSGIRFSIAAGNNRMNAADFTPARVVHQNTWTVSAFRQGDEFVQIFDWNTPNCNPGQSLNRGSNFGNPPINYSAPGENILSLWRNGGTRITCGTSMAAPHVAGLLLALGSEPVVNGYVSNDPSPNADPVASSRPAAPSISANVVSGHPQLNWSTVEDAVSYNIYRKVESNPWQYYASTSSITYTDNYTHSENMTVVPFAPTDNGIIRYRITAVPNAANESLYSNMVNFDMGDCSGPGCANFIPPPDM